MTTLDRINDLTIESTNTLLEALLQGQSQSVALAQSVLKTFEQNQQANRELATAILRQTQEAQKLWVQLAQESARSTTETFNRVGQEQVNRANETLNSVTNGMTTTTRRAAAATGNK